MYPRIIHISVLLYEDKIWNWKVSPNKKETPSDWTMRYSDFSKIPKMACEHTSFEVTNMEANNYIFSELAPEWFRKWEVHPESIIVIKPY
jgi:hypothetical protein